MAAALNGALAVFATRASVEEMRSTTDILSKYIGNVAQNPSEPKYRQIRKQNAVFQQKILNVPGASAILQAVGFVERGDFLEMGTPDLELLNLALKRLAEELEEKDAKDREAAKKLAENRIAAQKAKDQEKKLLLMQIQGDNACRKEVGWKSGVSSAAMKAGKGITTFGDISARS
uniref:PUB domain-containing protein n=1 Tax=Cyanoptyche gloeocystis TaxID=77922 RepID=A0A7S2JN08_9EUKA|mmetsp:Transcript_354/g.752  ORF Transcript_354/g.752 Transcript_354/m.752 type:complete len:175 (+) Transcript_354:111-635(+)|eukprot:CAMPEP_0196656740 /NCGR_PEP_ID=MMETSP1086-20130531/19408_1 /TAXON_ID=77921 /ORGANISM="Cyanoptyche  gloeocystis , Strain SAG4.97" /LENGTH=174 /DNA_ID=CAMNT_0041989601 /DNA_START=110 /DNA_END=634 /DNA_ORIENTATION=-